MKYSDIRKLEDCTQCPILQAGYCSGGMEPGPDGMPREQVCVGFTPDTDLDDWVLERYNYDKESNHQRKINIQKEKEKIQKTRLAQRRRRESSLAVRAETAELQRLRNWLGYYNRQLYTIEANAIAANIDLESEVYKVQKSILTHKIEETKQEIERVTKAKKAKLREIRKGRETNTGGK